MKTLHRKLDLEKTKTQYKKVAPMYDPWARLTETKAAAKVLELADIQNGQSVLEVACGTGVLFQKMAAQNPDGKSIGIDLSPDMLGKARKRMQQTGDTNYELREGNAFHLDFPDNTFDVLVNNFMVDLMPEAEFDHLAAEFYRVLKPNGVAVISTFAFGEKWGHRFWFWVAKHLPVLLTGCRPVDFKPPLTAVGFSIENDVRVSQLGFPAQVLKARKILL